MNSFLDPKHEHLIQETYNLACEHGVSVIKRFETPTDMSKDKEAVSEFYAKVHEGYALAQEIISEKMLELESSILLPDKRLVMVLRKLADSIGWQLLDRQLYIARRLFKEQKPPVLSKSNFQSVVETANYYNSEDNQQFALISDLTSFIQVGDLLMLSPLKRKLSIFEVKEGEKNHQILEFMKSYSQTQCDRALYYFAQKHGEKGIEQLKRMSRQANRMEEVRGILCTDKGVDSDTHQNISIHPDPIAVDCYDERLGAIIEKALQKGWALDVIDDCLFIGAYSGKMQVAAEVIFSQWFQGCGGHEEDPLLNLQACMTNPLALPIFTRVIPPASKFDVLFGRVTVLMALHIDAFISVSKESSIELKWATRKQAGRYNKIAGNLKRKNKPLVGGSGSKEMALSDGIVVRIMFHGHTPKTIINSFSEILEASNPDS